MSSEGKRRAVNNLILAAKRKGTTGKMTARERDSGYNDRDKREGFFFLLSILRLESEWVSRGEAPSGNQEKKTSCFQAVGYRLPVFGASELKKKKPEMKAGSFCREGKHKGRKEVTENVGGQEVTPGDKSMGKGERANRREMKGSN